MENRQEQDEQEYPNWALKSKDKKEKEEKSKKVYLFVFGVIFLIAVVGMTSATETSWGVVKQNTPISLTQTCGSCSYVNITSIQAPDKTFVLMAETSMQKTGTLYNYTSNFTQQIGTYIVTGHGDDGGVDTAWAASYQVTPTGNQLQTSDSLVYVVLLVILIILVAANFYIIAVIKVENPTKNGQPIGISLKKYLRIMLIGISYGLILLTINLMNALAISTSQVSQFAGIIGGLFDLMLRGTIVWSLIIVIWVAVTAWKDSILIKEIRKRLEEGEWFNE